MPAGIVKGWQANLLVGRQADAGAFASFTADDASGAPPKKEPKDAPPKKKEEEAKPPPKQAAAPSPPSTPSPSTGELLPPAPEEWLTASTSHVRVDVVWCVVVSVRTGICGNLPAVFLSCMPGEANKGSSKAQEKRSWDAEFKERYNETIIHSLDVFWLWSHALAFQGLHLLQGNTLL